MDKWISCKDRLPEDKVGKLLYTRSGHTINGYYNNNKWVSLFLGIFEGMEVTHWQELLEPPKGEQQL